MSEGPEEHNDLVDELGEIVRELRTYLDWQYDLGASGLPRDPRSPSELKQALPLGSPEQRRADEGGPAPFDQPSEDVYVEKSVQWKGRPAAAVSQPGHSATEKVPQRSLPVLGNDIDDLSALVRACTKCDLATSRTQTVFSRGTAVSGLCFVGEGPGADEDAQGLPFVGAAGQLLDRMIDAMGFCREDVYVCNIVKCRPPNNRKPTDDEIASCRPFLERQLELMNPQVIVALGATATLGLLGDTRGITKIRGKFRLYQGRVAVMPTFHPAYLLRNPSAKREVWDDLRQVLQHMGRTLPKK